MMKLGFRGKVFLGIIVIVLINSLFITLPVRRIVQDALSLEYQNRGLSIAMNLASRSQEPILSTDFLLLKDLIDNSIRSSGDIAYAFILDETDRILSHSFKDSFPTALKTANRASLQSPTRIQLLNTGKEYIYDFAALVEIGGQKLGCVRIGLSKTQIDRTIHDLLMTILLLSGCSVAVAGAIGAGFANQVAYRIKGLHKASEEVLTGNLDIQTSFRKTRGCWSITQCRNTECPAFGNQLTRCWYIEGTKCAHCKEGGYANKIIGCRECDVYRRLSGDEIQELAESFDAMSKSLRIHIHKLRESRKAIEISEEKYRRIFDGSMDMVFVVDSNGRFLDMNQAGMDLMGYDAKSDFMNQMSFSQLFSNPEDYEAVKNDLNSKYFVKDREILIRTRHGEDRVSLLSCTCQIDSAGVLKGCEGIIKDITERRNMEQQLLQADKLASLGQLSAGVAHEINNPLGLILGYTQLLLRDEPTGTQPYEDLKTIEKNTRNCKTIVEALLNFARKTETKKVTVDINAAIGQIVTVLQRQFEVAGIHLTTRLATNIPLIKGDTEKLKQVFMNLIMNARQSIEGKGDIYVFTEYDAMTNQVVINVEDTGSGIPEHIRHKIFDPFFTTKPTGQGTGLGLSVSYGIVKEHGGNISVQSELEKGSVFSVTIPVLLSEASSEMMPVKKPALTF
ncbi:MAG: ATP-binding protein [Desulfatirhabdiaceae bacterium]